MRHAVVLSTWSLLILLSGCLGPPLTLSKTVAGMEVSVATLGEYPTSISRIQLKDLDKKEVVWELIAKGKSPQLWGFKLVPGVNRSEISGVLYGQYEVVVPKGRRSFGLAENRHYEISVWDKEGGHRESARFAFEGRNHV